MLDDLRRTLIRQEETVIFALIERAQFKRNDMVYRPGGIQIAEHDDSFLAYFLRRTEEVHALTRRYMDPSEHPYSANLPDPLMEPLASNAPIVRNDINVNPTILDYYVTSILPQISVDGDCGNYGSSACSDVQCLQALSKRIHYGKFIAEAKFQTETDLYSCLIKARDATGIMTQLVDKMVENRVLRRVWKKASAYGSDPDFDDATPKVLPDVIVDIYREFLIPLTCEVEVDYLLRRLDVE
jgi:chorismate mutase